MNANWQFPPILAAGAVQAGGPPMNGALLPAPCQPPPQANGPADMPWRF